MFTGRFSAGDYFSAAESQSSLFALLFTLLVLILLSAGFSLAQDSIFIFVILLLSVLFSRQGRKGLLLYFVNSCLLLFFIYKETVFFLPDSGIANLKLVYKILLASSLMGLYLLPKTREQLVFSALLLSMPLYFYFYYEGFTLQSILPALFLILHTRALRQKYFIIFTALLLLFSFLPGVYTNRSVLQLSGFVTLFGMVSIAGIGRQYFHRNIGLVFHLYLGYILYATVVTNRMEGIVVFFTANVAGIHCNYHAYILMMFYPWMMFRYRKKPLRMIAYNIIYFYLHLQLHSRASIVGNLVALALFVFFMYGRKIPFYLYLGFASMAATITAVIFSVKSLSHMYSVTSIRDRMDLWRIYLDAAAIDGIVWGNGIGNLDWIISYPLHKVGELHFTVAGKFHAHNLYIQLLSNYGLVFVLALALVLGLYVKTAKTNSGRIFRVLWLPLFVAFLFHSFFEYVQNVQPAFFMLALPLGLFFRPGRDSALWIALAGKIVYTMVFAVFVFYLLAHQLMLAEARIVQKHIRLNHFENIAFSGLSDLSAKQKMRFELLASWDFLNLFNDKKEQLEAEYYFHQYQITQKYEYLQKAEKKYRKCISYNRYSTYCYARLSLALAKTGNAEESREMKEKALRLDPFHLLEADSFLESGKP